MIINNSSIGPSHRPYIIAELSANHHGSVAEGCKLIQAAADCGADAVKIQCYTADSLTFPGEGDEFILKGGVWEGRHLHELYKEAETPPQMVKELFRYARNSQITLFSSVFDHDGVDLMLELGAPALKIASFELVDLPLIQYAAKTGLPMIISTGMGTREEIMDAMNTFYGFSPHKKDLAMLHCISSYPANPSEANLSALGPLSDLLGARHAVGFSDHTLGFGTAAAAISFGASIIEKHFILDRNQGGPDSGFSMEPDEFSSLVMACREAWEAIQPHQPQGRGASANRAYRKSLYVVRDMACGDIFSTENLRAIRPAYGLSPKFYPSVLGASATQELKAGTPLRREMVSALC